MRSYQHLSREDREEIAARRAAGHRLGTDVAIPSIDHYQHRPVLQAHVRERRIISEPSGVLTSLPCSEKHTSELQ